MEEKEVTKLTHHDVLDALSRMYPGMEHYFVSDFYLDGHREDGDTKENPHSAHKFYVYAGCVDCLTAPVMGKVYRSVSYTGLLRLINSDDTEYTPDYPRKLRKRF